MRGLSLLGSLLVIALVVAALTGSILGSIAYRRRLIDLLKQRYLPLWLGIEAASANEHYFGRATVSSHRLLQTIDENQDQLFADEELLKTATQLRRVNNLLAACIALLILLVIVSRLK
jgi:hypothetical protein